MVLSGSGLFRLTGTRTRTQTRCHLSTTHQVLQSFSPLVFVHRCKTTGETIILKTMPGSLQQIKARMKCCCSIKIVEEHKKQKNEENIWSLKILATYLSMCHLHKNTYMCPFFYFPNKMFANILLKGIVHSKSIFHPLTTRHFPSADAFPKPRNPSRVVQTSSSHV